MNPLDSSFPGIDMHPADLRASDDPALRRVWSNVVALADTLGVRTYTTGYGMATLSIGDLIPALREALGEQVDLLAVTEALAAHNEETREYVWEIRRLNTPTDTLPTFDQVMQCSSEKEAAEWVEGQTRVQGVPHIAVRVTKTLHREVWTF